MEVDNETQSVVDYAIAEQEFVSIISQVYRQSMHTKGLGSSVSTGSCDSLSYVSGDISDFVPNPVYNMDVSTSFCGLTMPDGKLRSGKISVRFTRFNASEGGLVIKLIDYQSAGFTYSCDSITVDGSVPPDPSGAATLVVKLVNGICKTDNWQIRYSMEGSVFTEIGNDNGRSAVNVSGTGINRHGGSFSRESTLNSADWAAKYKNCAYFDKGQVTVTPGGFKTRIVNFGDGVCDNEATFTVKENTVAFKLK